MRRDAAAPAPAAITADCAGELRWVTAPRDGAPPVQFAASVLVAHTVICGDLPWRIELAILQIAPSGLAATIWIGTGGGTEIYTHTVTEAAARRLPRALRAFQPIGFIMRGGHVMVTDLRPVWTDLVDEIFVRAA